MNDNEGPKRTNYPIEMVETTYGEVERQFAERLGLVPSWLDDLTPEHRREVIRKMNRVGLEWEKRMLIRTEAPDWDGEQQDRLETSPEPITHDAGWQVFLFGLIVGMVSVVVILIAIWSGGR